MKVRRYKYRIVAFVIFILSAVIDITTIALAEETSAIKFGSELKATGRIPFKFNATVPNSRNTSRASYGFSGRWRGTAKRVVDGCRVGVPSRAGFSHNVRHSRGSLSLTDGRNRYNGTAIRGTSFNAVKAARNRSCIAVGGYLYRNIRGRRASVSPGLRIECSDGSWCYSYSIGTGSR